MANPLTFGNELIAAVQSFINDYEQLNLLLARSQADSTLVPNFVSTPNNGRPDLTVITINNAIGAWQQISIAANSGAPSQMAQLYEML